MGRTDEDDVGEEALEDAAQIQEIGEISVTERPTNVEGLAPSDATVHSQDGPDIQEMPPPPIDRQRGPVSGAVLPHLRHLSRELEPEPPAARKLWLVGPVGVGIAILFAVFIGLPAIVCCVGGSGEQPPEQLPTEVDGVRVRPGLK